MRIAVVVPCALSKVGLGADPIRLRDFDPGSSAERAVDWMTALRSAPTPRVPARDLYKGDHWSVCRELGAEGDDSPVDLCLWIASAGYGLIPIDAPVVNYSATFAAAQDDAVSRSRDAQVRSVKNREWWSALSEVPGPVADAPRTMSGLVDELGYEKLVVVASPPYLDAMHTDLSELVSSGVDPGRFAIVSAGLGADPILEPYAVEADARLSATFGGTRISLNARIAREFLRGVAAHRGEFESGRKRVAALMADAPDLKVYRRKALTDEEVREFVRDALATNRNASHTSTLRALRAEGFACEQSRFRELFQDERGREPSRQVEAF